MHLNKTKFALLFPGQGCQYIGMCHELIQEFPIAAEIFEEADSVLNFNLSSLILNGNIKELTLSENAQPAVVAASYALFHVFKKLTDRIPTCVIGHSLGEISALIAANALSFSDGISYARKRGKIMHKIIEEKKGRAAIVVDLEVNVLASLIDKIKVDDYITISGYNSPRQFIVAGSQTALLALEKEVNKKNGELIPFSMMPMKADAPYHSALMMFFKPEFEKLLQTIKFNKLAFDVWSTVTAEKITSEAHIPEILCNQLTLPVCWNQALKKICDSGVELLIDIGPHQIMANLIKENTRLPLCFAFDDKESKEKILSYFERRLEVENTAE